MPEEGVRGRLRRARPSVTRPSVTLTPVMLPEGELVVRSPTLADAAAWSAARLANRAWLERAYPAWGSDWEAEQSEVAWAQRWWRLQRLARAGRALPFVLTLDGRLIGEIGVEDVDAVSGAGEGSVWMVRSHGSPQVMNVASMLIIEYAFSKPDPLHRMLSPVATSSRQGRSPGLSAVGFQIEATLPRRVGDQGLVDHDIWVLHNTAETRRRVAAALGTLTAPPSTGPPPPTGPTGPTAPTQPTAGRAGRSARAPRRRDLAGTAARAAVREARAGLREARGTARRLAAARVHRPHRWSSTPVPTPTSLPTGPPTGAPALSRRPATRRDLARTGRSPMAPLGATTSAFEVDGQVVVVAAHRTDRGTATTEVCLAVRPGTADAVVRDAVRAVLDEVAPAPGEARVLLVRVPLGDPTAAPAAPLSALGLEQVATFPGYPAGAQAWGGEQVWWMPTAT